MDFLRSVAPKARYTPSIGDGSSHIGKNKKPTQSQNTDQADEEIKNYWIKNICLFSP